MSPTEERTLPRTLLIANPSLDVYGADLQMLESVSAMRDAGWRVVVASPTPGPLQDQLTALGAQTRIVDYPVLRRADSTPGGLVRLAATSATAVPRMRRLLREVKPDVCYVNTVTLPWWLAVGRAGRVPVVCHVHEAEPDVRRAVAKAMAAPLLLAGSVLVNSQTSLDALCDAMPRLRRRSTLIHNGVPGPDVPPVAPTLGRPVRVVSVGRLSPRKGPDLALEAIALLVAQGYDVHLDLCGTVVPGQEDYLASLERRADEPDLRGRVTFSGYTSPIWPALARADLFLAPARAEPFGNAVVEAQLAGRPVVATAQQGHLETVLDGETGVHVPTEDVAAMAAALAGLIDDPARARALADRARARAEEIFSAARYRDDIRRALESVLRS
jgi:glycosyltransferase involved in cell wall biosynthesis